MTSHALVVTAQFPPGHRPGSDRAVAIVGALVQRGWAVTVLTVDEQTLVDLGDHDPSSQARIDPSVAVVRVPLPHPGLQPEIDRWDRERAAEPVEWLDRWHLAERAEFPERHHGSWARDLTAAASRLHAEDPVDLVVSLCPPHACAAPGAHLASEHGITHVVDQQAPWVRNVDTERLRAAEDAADAERVLLASARRIWVPNAALAALCGDTHPDLADRVRVVPHAHDHDAFPQPRSERGALTFGLLGTVTDRMPLAATLQGWIRLRDSHDTCELHLRGDLGLTPGGSLQVESLLTGARPWGVSHAALPPWADRAAVLDTFDVLVLLVPTSRYATPPALYEYLATGRPIVSVHGTDQPALADLDGHPRWFPAASLRPRDIAAALSAAHDDARAGDDAMASRSAAHARRFTWDAVLADPIAEITALATKEAS